MDWTDIAAARAIVARMREETPIGSNRQRSVAKENGDTVLSSNMSSLLITIVRTLLFRRTHPVLDAIIIAENAPQSLRGTFIIALSGFSAVAMNHQ